MLYYETDTQTGSNGQRAEQGNGERGCEGISYNAKNAGEDQGCARGGVGVQAVDGRRIE